MNKLVEDAMAEFSGLPGIGKRSALRMVLSLLKKKPEEVERFGRSLIRLRQEIRFCGGCHNISENELCEICSDSRRDASLLCVVQDIRDVLSIENTRQFHGLYHVLGGIISPVDGIGPADLHVDTLVEKVRSGNVKEVIMALSATMEGDTTVFYLYRKLKDSGVGFSSLARGVAVGDELEYADEVTLGRSIVNRVPYENMFAR